MYKFIAIGLSAWLLAGCSSDVNTASESKKPGGYTVFNSTTGDIPYPNNILFSGSTDGTININASDDDPAKSIKDMIDTLDGFSTSAAITVSVTGDIDPNSLATGLHVYKVIAQASEATGGIPAVGLIEKELTFGVDFLATYSEGKVIVLPTIPLASHSNYMVVLTDTISDTKGRAISADAVTSMINGTNALVDANGTSTVYFDANAAINNGTASKLEGLRLLNQAMYAAMMANGNDCNVSTAGVTCNDVVMSWSFQTQTIGKVAGAFLANRLSYPSLEVNSTGIPTPLEAGVIYTGFLKDMPYYLGTISEANPYGPLTDTFTYSEPILPEPDPDNILPQKTASQDLPIIMSVPVETNATLMPEQGWPIVIYQHGITRNRTDMLALADAIASIGYVAIAMDLPLHGVDKLEPQSAVFYVEGKERTFDMDFVNNETGAAGPDNIIDASGTHYMNFSSLVTSRDNILQSTSDLYALVTALEEAKGIKLNPYNVSFIGHSLGTIASMPFINGVDLNTTTLAMPGANITQLLNFSATKGPELRAGLQAVAGIEPDSAEYNAFLLSAQTILDDADPINYSLSMPTSQKIFSLEIIGDESGNLPDQTIPNNAFPYAPLAGTDPMLALMQVSDLNVSALNASNQYIVPGRTVSRFTVGAHESIIVPDVATTEIQTQIVSFIQSQGAVIQVIDPSLLKQ